MDSRRLADSSRIMCRGPLINRSRLMDSSRLLCKDPLMNSIEKRSLREWPKGQLS